VIDTFAGTAIFAEGLRELDAFIAAHGHPFVPADCATANGWHLGRFLAEMRRASFASSIDPAVDAELAARGVDLAADAEAFSDGLARLERYAEREGHVEVPVTYRDADRFALGTWRLACFEGWSRGTLRGGRLRALERLGLFTAPSPAPAGVSTMSFERGLVELRRFVECAGHASVPARYATPDGYRLGQWCWWMRGRRHEGAVSAERIAALDQIGFVWSPRDAAFDRALAEFVSSRSPDGEVPAYSPSGFNLHAWCRNIRRRREKGQISPDQLAALEAAEFRWEEAREVDERFGVGLAALGRLIAAGSGSWVPSQFVDPDGFPLGSWLRDERAALRRGARSQEQRDALAARGVTKDAGVDRNAYAMRSLTRFRQAEPELLPHDGYRDSAGFGLASWLVVRRREAVAHALDPAIRADLMALGIDLGARANWPPGTDHDRFNVALRTYADYVAATGRRYPPRGTRMADSRDLSVWVMNTRLSWKLNRLSEEQIAAIDATGLTFDTSDTPSREDAFDTALTALRAFVAANGHAQIPSDLRMADGRKLASWCHNMRRRLRDGGLSDEKAAALVNAGLAPGQGSFGRPARPLGNPARAGQRDGQDTLGARLRRHRVETGMSLDEIARTLGVSPSRVRQIEWHHTRNPIKLALVGRIADLLRIDRPTAARLAGWPDSDVVMIYGVVAAEPLERFE
jgi:DNA-binding XRE family transcriptional regulator